MILQHLGIGFAAGIFAGIGLFALFITYQTRRIVSDIKEDHDQQRTALKQETTRIKKQTAERNKFNEVVSHQLEEASKIIEAQNNIATALRQPSQNALHSRHKNKMVGDWKILEDKKQEIFTNILKTGADPIVNVYDDRIKGAREMKLSQLMQLMGSNTLPIDEDAAGKKLQDEAGEGATVKKVVKNGKTFHVIQNKGNKTEH
jgi:hypothetical protein